MGCGPIRVGVWGGLGVVLEGARLGLRCGGIGVRVVGLGEVGGVFWPRWCWDYGIWGFCHTGILGFCDSVIIGFCRSGILGFCHTVVLEFCGSGILSFCENKILSFCDSGIPGFCHSRFL